MANAELWTVKVNGNVYDLRDDYAREAIKALQGVKHYLGTVTDGSTNKPEDGAAITPVTVILDGVTSTVTATSGQYVIYGAGEYLAADDGKWHKYGDHSGLGDLATKDEVNAAYAPEGTVALTPVNKTISEMTSAGSLPQLITTVSNGCLEISFDPGALPVSKETSVMEGATAKFTGTPSTITSK